MSFSRHRLASKILATLLGLALLCSSLPAQQQGDYVFRVESELVLVNVTVKDRNGSFVRGLKPEEFTILEDNKPQKVVSFDVENIDAVATQDVAQTKPLTGAAPQAENPAATSAADSANQFKDRRLIVLFFDLSAMEPDEIDRAITSAEHYVDTQMAPADLVSIVSLGSSLLVNQDFTSDHELLKKQLQAFGEGTGQGYEEGTTGTTEGTPDTGQPFTADDTEYNIFNTDRRLEALRSVAEKLAHVQQKKSLIYFSSGMDRTGIENQSELRAATNAAVRANLAIYTMDLRGLQALVAGGEAQNASLRGTSAYSGQSMINALNSNFTTQETLVTLASDTGGRAFLDSNDFSQVFKGVQQDTSTYYLLGYHSTNPARDGRYRRIVVKVNIPGVKVDYRRGYYAPADYQHSTKEDKELQLQEELASELPATDLPLYLGLAYFRMETNKFFIPVSLVVPGSEIPFTRSSDRDKATLDVIGAVFDSEQHPISRIRDTVKLAVDTSSEVRKKNVQYDTGLSLPPGKYHLKFVVRENQTGRMGSFETDLNVPDLKSQPLKMSSIILASQLQPEKKGTTPNPLIRDGEEIVPNVTHVFSANQHLRLYYEVYDPGRANAPPASEGGQAKPGIHLLTNVAFFRGKSKVFESSVVELTELNARDRKAGVFQLDLPLSPLKPGFYTCQVNVIDDAAGQFLFPRLALLIRPDNSSSAQ
ncbi:VWFA-related domain-containing protein [Candidatus Sulfotelmatobacter kueseliae]|uniref:VWFA-related domain-containing protein n=1 Tax=Candidatus Sulfotelmatobacter kueseliae TaxID=2042962 RepID=A0A2U3KLU1_9BACT|nr:VWFA-related domain-containing protein [Candidatus Sulfotelmatobacter kueseliae]